MLVGKDHRLQAPRIHMLTVPWSPGVGWNTEMMWALSLPANPDKPSFRPYHTAQGPELRQPHLHVDIAVIHGFTEPSLSWAGQGSGPSERPPGFKPRVRTVVTWVIIQWAQQKLAVCFCWGCPGAAVQTYPGSAPSNTRFLITAPPCLVIPQILSKVRMARLALLARVHTPRFHSLFFIRCGLRSLMGGLEG